MNVGGFKLLLQLSFFILETSKNVFEERDHFVIHICMIHGVETRKTLSGWRGIRDPVGCSRRRI